MRKNQRRDAYARYSRLITTGQREGKVTKGDLGESYVQGVNDAFDLIYGEGGCGGSRILTGMRHE